MIRRLVACGVLLTACVPPTEPAPPDEDPTPAPEVEGGGLAVGPVIDCVASDLAFAALTEEAADRGLDAVTLDSPAPVLSSRLLLHDLDLDGDLDVVFGSWAEAPQVFENDGTGHFTRADTGMAPPVQSLQSLAAADLDGDGLPELVGNATGWVAAMVNLGGQRFASATSLYEVLGLGTTHIGPIAIGDVDADGDLDIATSSPDPAAVATGDPETGQHDLLLLAEPGGHRLAQMWPATGEAKPPSSLPFLIDRERDGDLDLLVAGLRLGPDSAPARYLRNDGPGASGPDFVVAEPGAGLVGNLAAMGLDSADLDGDGYPELCVADAAAVRCLSGGADGWIDSTAQFGLAPPSQDPTWAGWGLELQDLDNDGLLDMAVVGDNDPALGDPGQGLDRIWRGQVAGRFDPQTGAGLDGASAHYGLAAGDVNGDGALDLVAIGDEDVELWMNVCTVGDWVDVDLVGPPGNSEAFGAWVEVQAGGRTQGRTLHAVRGSGQGPSRVHVGLGDDPIESVRVVWPDGRQTLVRQLPSRARLLVSHPDASGALVAALADTL